MSTLSHTKKQISGKERQSQKYVPWTNGFNSNRWPRIYWKSEFCIVLPLPVNWCVKALLSFPQKRENSGNYFMTSHARVTLSCSGVSSPIAGNMGWVRVTFQQVTFLLGDHELFSAFFSGQNIGERLGNATICNLFFNTPKLGRKSQNLDP